MHAVPGKAFDPCRLHVLKLLRRDWRFVQTSRVTKKVPPLTFQVFTRQRKSPLPKKATSWFVGARLERCHMKAPCIGDADISPQSIGGVPALSCLPRSRHSFQAMLACVHLFCTALRQTLLDNNSSASQMRWWEVVSALPQEPRHAVVCMFPELGIDFPLSSRCCAERWNQIAPAARKNWFICLLLAACTCNKALESPFAFA